MLTNPNPNADGTDYQQVKSPSGRAAMGLTHDGTPEGYANAQLIASAPSLRAQRDALKAALEALVQFHNEEFARDPFTPNAHPDSPVQQAWLKARAALTLCHGEGK